VTVIGATVIEARCRELGACMRAHRQLIRPADVGLPAAGRRRTPGLRREEVAELAGVGLSWYTWMEQGRVRASGQVVDAVGRVLGLDAVGRRHLRMLTAPPEPPAPPAAAELAPLLASWPASPAVLLDHRLDMHVANPRWTQLWGDPRDLAPTRRNVLWQLAADPRTPAALAEPEPLIRAVARQFRMAANQYAGDRRITEIVTLLRAEAPRHRPFWDCRGVGAFEAPEVRVGAMPTRAHLLHANGHAGAAVLVLAENR
jgi:hypothetical protein